MAMDVLTLMQMVVVIHGASMAWVILLKLGAPGLQVLVHHTSKTAKKLLDTITVLAIMAAAKSSAPNCIARVIYPLMI